SVVLRGVAWMRLDRCDRAAQTVRSMATARAWLAVGVGALATLLPPTLLAAVGLAYVVAGLTIVFKQVNALLQLSQFVLMAFAYVPVSQVPALELAPTAKGIDMVRRVLAEGAPLSSFGAADWASVWATGALYFALGLVVFKLFERRAMRLGLLGHY